MNLTLTPEQAQIIQAQIQSGRQKSQVAVDRVDRGEVLDGATVVAQRQEQLRKAREAEECPNS